MTLREHLEAIRDRCRPIADATPAENQAYEHAVAALAILDVAKPVSKAGPGSLFRMVYDQQAGTS